MSSSKGPVVNRSPWLELKSQVLELEVGLSESLLPLLEFDAALEVPESPLRAYWRF